MSVKVAFASIDGSQIDQHFGNARYFQIFDIENGTYKQIETRRTKANCKGSCEGGFDHLLVALKDCDAVFVIRIGQSAANFMISHGKRVFEASGGVEDILDAIVEGNLLEELG